MMLAIDVGNTNSVFAVCDGADIIAQWRIATNPNRTADEYGFWLRHLLQSDAPNCLPLKGAIMATVVPQTQFELKQCLRKYFHTETMLVGIDTPNMTIGVDVDNPSEVGADRLVNALQAWKIYNSALIVIDFGTATTFDVVSEKGDYIGGVIAPGMNLSLQALQSAAAKLPNIRIRQPNVAIGRNTIAAMESGIYYGYVGMVKEILQRIKKEVPELKKIIATGGLATLYARDIIEIDEVINDLTIDGLISLYELNNQVVIQQ